jgi:hypothetical protein
VDFLLDVNASGAVARWLIDRGHDVAEVGQIDPRMSDRMTLLNDALDSHVKDLEAGAIVIALRTKFRIRKRW